MDPVKNFYSSPISKVLEFARNWPKQAIKLIRQKVESHDQHLAFIDIAMRLASGNMLNMANIYLNELKSTSGKARAWRYCRLAAAKNVPEISMALPKNKKKQAQLLLTIANALIAIKESKKAIILLEYTADLLISMHQTERAFKVVEKLATLDPSNASLGFVCDSLINECIKKGKYNKALEVLELYKNSDYKNLVINIIALLSPQSAENSSIPSEKLQGAFILVKKLISLAPYTILEGVCVLLVSTLIKERKFNQAIEIEGLIEKYFSDSIYIKSVISLVPYLRTREDQTEFLSLAADALISSNKIEAAARILEHATTLGLIDALGEKDLETVVMVFKNMIITLIKNEECHRDKKGFIEETIKPLCNRLNEAVKRCEEQLKISENDLANRNLAIVKCIEFQRTLNAVMSTNRIEQAILILETVLDSNLFRLQYFTLESKNEFQFLITLVKKLVFPKETIKPLFIHLVNVLVKALEFDRALELLILLSEKLLPKDYYVNRTIKNIKRNMKLQSARLVVTANSPVTSEWRYPTHFYMAPRSHQDVSLVCPAENEEEEFLAYSNQDHSFYQIPRVIEFVQQQGSRFHYMMGVTENRSATQCIKNIYPSISLYYEISKNALISVAKMKLVSETPLVLKICIMELSEINRLVETSWSEETYNKIYDFIIYFVNQLALDGGMTSYSCESVNQRVSLAYHANTSEEAENYFFNCSPDFKLKLSKSVTAKLAHTSEKMLETQGAVLLYSGKFINYHDSELLLPEQMDRRIKRLSKDIPRTILFNSIDQPIFEVTGMVNALTTKIKISPERDRENRATFLFFQVLGESIDHFQKTISYAIDDIENRRKPVDDKENQGKPVDDKENQGKPVDDKENQGKLVDDKENQGKPVNDKENQGKPVKEFFNRFNLSQNSAELLSRHLRFLCRRINYSVQRNLFDNVGELNFAGYHLHFLPEEVGYLKNLRKLDLTECKLHKLPNSIGKLKKLEILDLTGNYLRSLPSTITECRSLYLIKGLYDQLSYSSLIQTADEFLKTNNSRVATDLEKQAKKKAELSNSDRVENDHILLREGLFR